MFLPQAPDFCLQVSSPVTAQTSHERGQSSTEQGPVTGTRKSSSLRAGKGEGSSQSQGLPVVTGSGAPDITPVCNKADQLANPQADAFMGSEEAESEGLSPTEGMSEYPNTDVLPHDAAASKEGRHTHTDPACKEPGIQHKHPTETPVPMTFSCQQAAPDSLLPTEVMSDTAGEEAILESVDPAILIINAAHAAVSSTQSQTEQALKQSSDSGTSFQHLVEPENAFTVDCQQPGSQTVPPAAAMSDRPDTHVDPPALLSDAVVVTEVCTHAQTHQASEQSNHSRVKAVPSTEEISVALASPSQQAGLQSVHDFPYCNDSKSAVPAAAAAVGSAATDSQTDVPAPVVASPHCLAAFSAPASAAEVSACESTAPQHQSAQHLPVHDLHTSSLEVAHATAAEPEQAVLAVSGQLHSESPAVDSNRIAATDMEYPGQVLAVSNPAASDEPSANSGQIAEEAEGQQAGQAESVPLAAEPRQTINRQVVSGAGQAELLSASNGQNTTMELGSAVPLLPDAGITASQPEHGDALQWDSASCIVVPDSEEPESFIPIPVSAHDNTAGDNSAAHSSAGQAVHHAGHSSHAEQFVEHSTAVGAAAVCLPGYAWSEPDQSQHGEQPEVADVGHAAAAADAALLHSSGQTKLHTGRPTTAVQAASRHDLDMTKCLSVHESADKPDARAQALAGHEARGQDKDSKIASAGASAELCEDEAEQQQQAVHVEETDAEIEQADSSYRQAEAKQRHFEQQQQAAQHAILTEHADTGDAPIMIMSC